MKHYGYEIYENKTEELVIKQSTCFACDEDVFILIDPSQLDDFIDHLRAVADNIGS